MPVKFKAHFENSDMADLALARLKRAGVAFSVAQETPRRPEIPVYEPWYATNAIFPYTTRPDRLGGTTVKLSLSEQDVDKAKSILRQAQGTIYP